MTLSYEIFYYTAVNGSWKYNNPELFRYLSYHRHGVNHRDENKPALIWTTGTTATWKYGTHYVA